MVEKAVNIIYENNRNYYFSLDINDFEQNEFQNIEEAQSLALILLRTKKYDQYLEPLNQFCLQRFQHPLYRIKLFYLSEMKDIRLSVFEIEIDGKKEKRAVKIQEGTNVYLGIQVKDIGKHGFSEMQEIKQVLDEMEEDIQWLYDITLFDKKTESYALTRKISLDEYKDVVSTQRDTSRRDKKDLMNTYLNRNEDFVLSPNTAKKRLRRLLLIVSNIKGDKALADDNKKLEAYDLIFEYGSKWGFEYAEFSIKKLKS